MPVLPATSAHALLLLQSDDLRILRAPRRACLAPLQPDAVLPNRTRGRSPAHAPSAPPRHPPAPARGAYAVLNSDRWRQGRRKRFEDTFAKRASEFLCVAPRSDLVCRKPRPRKNG